MLFAALQSYGLAAGAADHFPFGTALSHVNVVMQVVDKLREDKLPQAIAVIYDRIVRSRLFTAHVRLKVVRYLLVLVGRTGTVSRGKAFLAGVSRPRVPR